MTTTTTNITSNMQFPRFVAGFSFTAAVAVQPYWPTNLPGDNSPKDWSGIRIVGATQGQSLSYSLAATADDPACTNEQLAARYDMLRGLVRPNPAADDESGIPDIEW